MLTPITDKKGILEKLKSRTRIDTTTGCWLWTGARQYPNRGYGVIRLFKFGLKYYVHRLSAYIHLDLDIHDNSILICHKNQCPNKHCWNPEHIYVGNHDSNYRDDIEAGRKIRDKKGRLVNPTNEEND
jgi:hypothetical protein